MIAILYSLFDLSRNFNLNNMLGQWIEIIQKIILVALLHLFGRPYLHELL